MTNDLIEKYKHLEWDKYPDLEEIKSSIMSGVSQTSSKTAVINEEYEAMESGGRFECPANGSKLRSKIKPKYIKKFMGWRIPALKAPLLDRYLFSTDATGGTYKVASMHSRILNYTFNKELHKTQLLNKVVDNFSKQGTIIGKVEWEEKISEEQTEVLSDSGEVVGVETVNHVVQNSASVKVVDVGNMIVSPECKYNIDDAKYLVHIDKIKISDMRLDDRYSYIEEVVLTESTSSMNGHDIINNDSLPEEAKEYYVHEYWGYFPIHGGNQLVPIIMSWIGETVVRLEVNEFGETPFVLAPYIYDSESIFGTTDIALLMDNQEINGSLIRGMLDIMGKNAIGQRGTLKNALDTEERKKFEAGEDYEVNSTINNINDVSLVTNYEPVQPVVFDMLRLASNESESLTGIRPFADGVNSGSLGDVASGIKEANASADMRTEDIFSNLQYWFIEVGKKMASLNRMLLTDEQLVLITGEPEQIEVPVPPENIPPDIDPSSVPPMWIPNPLLQQFRDFEPKTSIQVVLMSVAKRENKMQMLNMRLQTNAAVLKPHQVSRYNAELERLAGNYELARQFEEESIPTEEEERSLRLDNDMKQLEVEYRQAQIRDLNARAAENEVDMQLKQAKVTSENAKAKELNSRADAKDLEFVRKESGQEHQEKLETEQQKADLIDQQKSMDELRKLGGQ